MSDRLYDYLSRYSDGDFYPFHMPGHKRNIESELLSELYRLDITEIDGFDNLHQPESIIRDAQQRAAQLYHSEETYFLVNGSTSGILSAVSAIAQYADKLLIARNCHKAVYNAAFFNRMELFYVYPKVIDEYDIAGEISAVDIEKQIIEIIDQEGGSYDKARETIAGVVITSPSYDGIVSDVKAIAQVAHRYGLPLIVDQAHGAHFGLHPGFPENAVSQGADIVIHSVHKTLPAPTQTALIHRNGDLISGEVLRKYLSAYQSSSPSYLLMAGIDEAVAIACEQGADRLENLLKMRNDFLKRLEGCRYIKICPLTEPGKLLISVKESSITGQELYDILLEKYHLQMEMASGSYVIAILTMMDTYEGLRRLYEALLEIDQMIAERVQINAIIKELPISTIDISPERKMNLWEAYNSDYEEVNLFESEGEVVADFVNLYPPGIPILVPGEKINKEFIDMVESYRGNGYTVQGIHHLNIRVVKPQKKRRDI